MGSDSMYGQQAALYDAATGLPRAPLFYDRVQRALLLAQRESLQASVLLIRLEPRARERELSTDEHRVALTELGLRFVEAVRVSDSAGRLSSNEFGILLPNALELGVPTVAQRVFDTLSEPVVLGAGPFHYDVSIGVAVCGARGDFETLLQNARAAMLTAVEGGGGIVLHGGHGRVPRAA